MRGGGDRVLEGHDAPDQVEPGAVQPARHPARVVVRACSAVVPRDRRCAGHEGDVAALVLHVDFQRVEPAVLERDVLVELAGQRQQRHRDVDAADLLGQLPVERARGHGRADRDEHDRRTGPRARKELHEAEDGSRRETGEHRESGDPPPADLAPSRVTAPPALVGVIEVRRDCHEGWDRSP